MPAWASSRWAGLLSMGAPRPLAITKELSCDRLAVLPPPSCSPFPETGNASKLEDMADIQRRKSVTVKIGSGPNPVRVGWEAPVVVQSMTNTDTADVQSTIDQ